MEVVKTYLGIKYPDKIVRIHKLNDDDDIPVMIKLCTSYKNLILICKYDDYILLMHDNSYIKLIDATDDEAKNAVDLFFFKGKKNCFICMDKNVSFFAVLRCCSFCICESCKNQLKICPLCDTVIQ